MQEPFHPKQRNISLHFKIFFMTAILLGLVGLLATISLSNTSATGDGSPSECEDPTGKSENNDDLLTFTATGQTITGVCIKTGDNMFSGTGHSGLLENGTYESCYTVSGVGTDTVTVTRTGAASETCQALSHVDVFASSPSSPPTPSPSPSSSPTSSPTPSPSPSSTPTPTPTPTPTVSPSPTAATPTPTTNTTSTTTTTAAGAVLGATAEAPTPTPSPGPTGAVLGASAELPATGPENIWLISAILTLLSGTGLTALGFRKK